MSLKRTSPEERVAIWNSFLHLAREAAVRLGRGNLSTAPRGSVGSGKRLSEEQEEILAALTFCTLAIEARANHLLEIGLEKGWISKNEFRAAQRLPPQHKWFLLPRILGRRRKITIAEHNAVREVCAWRNSLVHVDFPTLTHPQKGLPTSTKMRQLVRDFILAMDDLNIVLGRATRIRKAVKRLARV